MRSVRPFLPSLACILTILAVAVILFHSLIFGDRTLFFGDISLYFVPLLAFQKAELLRGIIPLWNPHILCGTPFVGNPQAWPLYPTSLLLYALRPEHAAGVDGVLHLVWAAVGTFVFLRHRGLDRIASLFAALAWGFGGALVSKMQFPNMVQAASWLPWLLWSLDRLIDRPDLFRASLLAVSTALALLAAHPQMFLMQFYLGIAWLIFRIAPKTRAERLRILGFAALAVLCGVMLASEQLFAVVQTAQTSVRPSLGLAKANRFILPPYAALTNLILPNFYGNPATTTEFVARGNFWEASCYAGFLAFSLAIGAAILLFRPNREVRFWTICGLLCLWAALGRESGLYAAVFYAVPGVSKFHDAARFLQPATFALACLAAYGLDAVGRQLAHVRHRRIAGLTLLLINMIDLAIYVQTLNPTVPAGFFPLGEVTGERRQRAYYADERLLWGRFVSYRSYEAVNVSNRVKFASAIGPNLTTLAGYDLVNGYEPVHGARIDKVLSVLDAQREPGAEMLRRAGADVVIRLNRSTSGPEVRPVDGSLGRAWFDGVALPVEDFSPDSVVILIPMPHEAGNVVVADTLEPGWAANVDGRDEPIALTNGAFRSIRVNAMDSNDTIVKLRYQPMSWRLGAFLSLAASGILCVIWGAGVASAVKRRSG